MSSSAKRRRWNAYPPYISSFEKYCLCASLFLAGNYSNSPPLTSPPLHLSTLWKKKESCYFYIYLLNPWYIFWVLHLQLVFNPTFKGFFFPYSYKNWKYIPEKYLKNHQRPWDDQAQTCVRMHTHSFSASSTMNAEFALILRNSLLTLLHTHTYSNALPLVRIHPLPRWHTYSLSFTTLFASEQNYSTVEIAISNFHPLLLFQGAYAVVQSWCSISYLISSELFSNYLHPCVTGLQCFSWLLHGLRAWAELDELEISCWLLTQAQMDIWGMTWLPL